MATMTLTSVESIEPGNLGNLSPDQERALQEAWVHLLRLCGNQDVKHGAPDKSPIFMAHLKDKSPDHFRKSLWESTLGDNPDALVLRFLRARKWDVTKGVEMLVSAVNWRDERQIFKSIVGGGEGVGLKAKRTPDEEAFMAQYRSGKAYVRGADKDGHPVYIIKVRLHDPNKQPASVMEDFALHNIETLRPMARSRKDKVCLIFDLTGFGLRNMDFHFIKFLISILEARYPETLNVVLVHNAPFVFWGIWNVIKHWLDPVIASKINFTSGSKGMAQFIPKDNLQKCYGGDDKYEYKYAEPVVGENECMQSEEKKVKILGERDELAEQFVQHTVEWVSLDPVSELGQEKNRQRGDVIRDLEENSWQLDPYIRSTTFYHRAGVLGRQGEVNLTAAR
ncbi:hypothetical protein NLU13_2716 [Sarocladium strictum]|uniref:CRAL-TRIO domain-containing protein n=1 Tax=Sarocladium strictum TaxID=5046 RepID=A0AA39GLE0_SARSR|nr:hypothetical protein NLU13_2716 [Sarocladium strictum]